MATGTVCIPRLGVNRPLLLSNACASCDYHTGCQLTSTVSWAQKVLEVQQTLSPFLGVGSGNETSRCGALEEKKGRDFQPPVVPYVNNSLLGCR